MTSAKSPQMPAPIATAIQPSATKAHCDPWLVVIPPFIFIHARPCRRFRARSRASDEAACSSGARGASDTKPSAARTLRRDSQA